MLELEHGIKQEAVQSPNDLIYNIEIHQDWSRKVIWPEETGKTDQLITIKSTSPMDGSSASADHCDWDKKSAKLLCFQDQTRGLSLKKKLCFLSMKYQFSR